MGKKYRITQPDVIVNRATLPVNSVVDEEALGDHLEHLTKPMKWKYPGRGVVFKQRDEKTGEMEEIKNERILDEERVCAVLVSPAEPASPEQPPTGPAAPKE